MPPFSEGSAAYQRQLWCCFVSSMLIVLFLLVECGLLHPTTISYVIADGKLKNFLGGGCGKVCIAQIQ
jgi:hypothetical protein